MLHNVKTGNILKLSTQKKETKWKTTKKKTK